ncbi:hypothetical protein ACS0TY_002120 [Phlomoides rotata]
MEEPQSLDHDQNRVVIDHRSNVDSSRPFRSVKEAVAIFGERILVGEIYSPKPFSFSKKETPFFSPSLKLDTEPISKYSSPSPRGYSQDTELADTVKKLEVELEETKNELNLLKERESETEVALASLNAELHQSMSKAARAEAEEAAKAASAASGEKEKKRDLIGPSLAQVLSVGEKESLFVGRKKGRKKKPIIPLVGNLFSRKKGLSTTLQNPLYASSSSSHFHYN